MAKFTKTCRVCGKTYQACFTPARPGVFRWQDVACSPECGNVYLDRIIASRNKSVEVTEEVAEAQPDVLSTESDEATEESEVFVVDSDSAESVLESDYDEYEDDEDEDKDDDYDIDSTDEEE